VRKLRTSGSQLSHVLSSVPVHRTKVSNYLSVIVDCRPPSHSQCIIFFQDTEPPPLLVYKLGIRVLASCLSR
jgi:hypothetical protein